MIKRTLKDITTIRASIYQKINKNVNKCYKILQLISIIKIDKSIRKAKRHFLKLFIGSFNGHSSILVSSCIPQ